MFVGKKETQFAARVRIHSPHSARARRKFAAVTRAGYGFFAEDARAAREENFAVRYGALQIFAPPLRPVSTFSASVTKICFVRDL